MPLLPALTCAFTLGILLGDALRPAPSLAATLSGLTLVPCLLFSLRDARGLRFFGTMLVAFVALGSFAAAQAWREPPSWQELGPWLEDRKPALYEGRVVWMAERFLGRERVEVDLLSVLEGTTRVPVRGRVLLGAPGPLGLLPGDRVLFETRLKKPGGFRNPGAFDTERFLRGKGIDLVGWVEDPSRVVRFSEPAPRSLLRGVARLRAALEARLEQRLSGDARGLTVALLLGDRGGVREEIEEDFRIAGVTHVLSVSGLHLAVAAFLFFTGLRRVLAWVPGAALRFDIRQISAFAAIPAVIAYTLLTGAATATVRSAVMAVVFFLGVALDRSPRTDICVAAAALAILIVSPLELFAPSFQLTFAAVIGLLVSAPASQRLRERISWPGLRGRGARWAIGYGVASLSALLFTAPVAAWHFGQVSPLGLVANFLIVPLAEMIVLPVGLFSLLLSPVLGPVADLGIAIAGHAATVMVWMAHAFRAISPNLRVPPPSLLEGCAWLVGSVALFSRMPKRWLVLGGSLAVLTLSAGGHAALRSVSSSLRITFLDVGDADAAFVEFPGGETMLVDAGGTPEGRGNFDIGESVIAPFLRARRIRSLDRAVVTHPHPDHVGGFPFLLGEFPTKEVLMTEAEDPNEAFERFLAALARHGPPVRRPTSFTTGGVTVEVLHPHGGHRSGEAVGPEPASAYPTLSANNNSLVLRLTYGGRRVLLMGDVEKEAEALLLAKSALGPVDVLKVGHHGSRTSSSEPFVKAVSPRVAVISASGRSRHGFPHPEVVERWYQSGAQVLHTGQVGAVTVTIQADGDISVTTERGRPRVAERGRPRLLQ